MTIATCFRFDDGVLFGADTKITADIKTNESKFSKVSYKDDTCRTVFVFSGAVPYARMAIRQCERAISALAKNEITMDSIEGAIESTLVEFHQTHIFPHPDRGKDDGPEFELLVGTWMDGETRMLISENDTLSLVEDYACAGTGSYLARYWTKQFYAAHQFGRDWPITRPTVEQAGLIAACALRSAMDVDEYCGGHAEFLVLKNDGEFGSEVNATIFEEFPTRLQAAAWRMLAKIVVAPGKPDKDAALEAFFDETRSFSGDFDWWFDLGRSLSTSVSPSASPSPESKEED